MTTPIEIRRRTLREGLTWLLEGDAFRALPVETQVDTLVILMGTHVEELLGHIEVDA